MKRKFPNLFIIGAPKCGTTSLAHWLSEHPQVYFYLGKKKIQDTKLEPHFWASDLESYQKMSEEEYLSIFNSIDEREYMYAGEASVWYLYSDKAVKNIQENIKDPKYIVCIRNPVDMAYSLWLHRIREGVELIKDDFLEAFNLSSEREAGNLVGVNKQMLNFITAFNGKGLSYKSVCSLGTQLERLLKIASKEQVLILVLEDIIKNPAKEWKKVLNFLSLADDNRQLFPIHNKGKALRNEFMYKLYAKLIEFNIRTFNIRKKFGISLGLNRFLKNIVFKELQQKKLKPEERKELVRFFMPEIEKIEEILGRKFDEWKK